MFGDLAVIASEPSMGHTREGGSATLNFDLTPSTQTGVEYAAAAAQNADAKTAHMADVQDPRISEQAAPELSARSRIGMPGQINDTAWKAYKGDSISNS